MNLFKLILVVFVSLISSLKSYSQKVPGYLGKRLYFEAGAGGRVTGADMLSNELGFSFWYNMNARIGYVTSRKYAIETGLNYTYTKDNGNNIFSPGLKNGLYKLKVFSFDFLAKKYRTSKGALSPVGPYTIYGVSFTNSFLLINDVATVKAVDLNLVYGKGYVKFINNKTFINLGYQIKIPTQAIASEFDFYPSNVRVDQDLADYAVYGILLHNSFAFLRLGRMLY